MPSDKASPQIGSAHKLAAVEGKRIEVTCDKEQALDIINSIKAIHPYEETLIECSPLLNP